MSVKSVQDSMSRRLFLGLGAAGAAAASSGLPLAAPARGGSRGEALTVALASFPASLSIKLPSPAVTTNILHLYDASPLR